MKARRSPWLDSILTSENFHSRSLGATRMETVGEDDEDAALNAQILASLHTLVMILIFCGGVAFGYLLGSP